MLWIILGLVVSYLVGSIPTAYILGRLIKHKDLRQFGSHNVGATNAFRVLGKGIGIAVLFIDIIKGIIPVVMISDYIILKNNVPSGEIIRVILGVAGACGHNWTVFLNFKGGKGVAVTFGVLIGLVIKYSSLRMVFVCVLGVWVVSFVISRMVSFASILSSLAFPVCMLLFKQERVFLIMSIVLSVFIIYRHKPNIKRLLAGKEPRLFKI